ncbi:MAG: hypothetical protein QM725_18245 [Lacibacter sp.]
MPLKRSKLQQRVFKFPIKPGQDLMVTSDLKNRRIVASKGLVGRPKKGVVKPFKQYQLKTCFIIN